MIFSSLLEQDPIGATSSDRKKLAQTKTSRALSEPFRSDDALTAATSGEQASMADRTVHATVSGRVQGVGYREWTRRKAVAAGLAGWGRKLRDGTVEELAAFASRNVSARAEAARNLALNDSTSKDSAE